MSKFANGIWREFKTAMDMSFGSAMKEGYPGGNTWMKDPHLRNGFLFGLPVFIGCAMIFLFSGLQYQARIAVLVFAALVSNLIWLGYAAWSRDREKSRS